MNSMPRCFDVLNKFSTKKFIVKHLCVQSRASHVFITWDSPLNKDAIPPEESGHEPAVAELSTSLVEVENKVIVARKDNSAILQTRLVNHVQYLLNLHSLASSNTEADIDSAIAKTNKNLSQFLQENLHKIKPALPSKSYSIVPYFGYSSTLKKLLAHGVDLSSFEPKVANFLVNANFKQEIQPLFIFFLNLKIKDSEIASILSLCPPLFLQGRDLLKKRLEYLQSKMFTKRSAGRLMKTYPKWFCIPIEELDQSLGFLQQEFELDGLEMQQLILGAAEIVEQKQGQIQITNLILNKFCGFERKELKRIVTHSPHVYFQVGEQITERFNLLHNEMGISHEQILNHPKILNMPIRMITLRHQFLKELKRDQFDKEKPNYVSMTQFSAPLDKFLSRAGNVSVDVYDKFCKTQ